MNKYSTRRNFVRELFCSCKRMQRTSSWCRSQLVNVWISTNEIVTWAIHIYLSATLECIFLASRSSKRFFLRGWNLCTHTQMNVLRLKCCSLIHIQKYEVMTVCNCTLNESENFARNLLIQSKVGRGWKNSHI